MISKEQRPHLRGATLFEIMTPSENPSCNTLCDSLKVPKHLFSRNRPPVVRDADLVRVRAAKRSRLDARLIFGERIPANFESG